MGISINFLGWYGKNENKIHKYGKMGPDYEWQLTYITTVYNNHTLMLYMTFAELNAGFGPQGIGEEAAQMY